MKIRKEVFVTEQGFVDEFDEIDGISSHILIFDGDLPVATCRVFKKDGEEYHILGRLAVLKEYRGKGLGRAMLDAAEKYVSSVGGMGIILHSQLRAVDFYQACGYEGYGDIENEEGYPHLWMKKKLR
jgi:predicted GNAT family N-acyltransferase